MHEYVNPVAAAARAAGPSNPFARTAKSLSAVQRPYVMCRDGICTSHSGRRAGKSRANGVKLLRPARANPGGLSFFAAKDAKTAKRIIWATLKELNFEYDLGCRFHRSELIVEAPNGYCIWLLGLNDDGEADKLRGSTHGLVEGIIDEASTIREDVLRYAAIECALPALGENAGRLSISGTPGALMQGFFYEQCQSRTNFHWDARQNPFLKVPGERYLANALKNNPTWTWETPTFQREYLGIWCEDRDALVYPYEAGRNLIYEGGEFHEGQTVLGVDVGFEDGMGYCVTRSQPPYNPEIHVLRCYERLGQKLPAIAAEIETLRRRYSVNHIFVDEGNNGLLVSKSLCEMGIPCMPTPKGLKRPRIEEVRGALAAGTLKVLRGQCDTLVGEMGIIPWNEKRTDVDPRYSNECTDSLIYSVLPHRKTYEHLIIKPAVGSREDLNEKQMTDKEREERESITRADLDKISAHMNRVRGHVERLQRPEPGAIDLSWRR